MAGVLQATTDADDWLCWTIILHNYNDSATMLDSILGLSLLS
jgi:hypothetical protein